MEFESKGLGDCIQKARTLHGEEAARMVRGNALDIARTLGGRYDLYGRALEKAARSRCGVRELHPWCLTTAKDLASKDQGASEVAPVAFAVPPPSAVSAAAFDFVWASQVAS